MYDQKGDNTIEKMKVEIFFFFLLLYRRIASQFEFLIFVPLLCRSLACTHIILTPTCSNARQKAMVPSTPRLSLGI